MRPKDGPVKSTFGESIRLLAKSYYPFIYSDSRNISKPVVDLQAAFEVCSESLDEFDRLSNEISGLNYAIYGLQQALYQALNQLAVVRNEVGELMTALRNSEQFNLRLLDQLSSLDENLQSGMDSSRSILSTVRLNMAAQEHYMIPRSIRDTLEGIMKMNQPTVCSASGTDELLKAKTSSDFARSNWLIQIQRDLAHRHAEFSFLVISLWSEQVRDNFHLSNRKSSLIPGGPKTSYDKRKGVPSEEDSMLRMASSARIEEIPTVIQTIQSRVFEIGSLIVDELNRLRNTAEDTRLQHRTLNMELTERRKQLIDCLLATQGAVQTQLELEERSDALVGKLVKTRPLFTELYRVVQNENLADEFRETAHIQTLSEALGERNWQNLIYQLGKLKVHEYEERIQEPD